MPVRIPSSRDALRAAPGGVVRALSFETKDPSSPAYGHGFYAPENSMTGSDSTVTLGVDDSLLESAAACLNAATVQALGELKLSESARCRVSLLAEKANGGLLTREEELEYERFMEVGEIIATLRLKAMRRMQQAHAKR
jgi:hypothetical protein